MRQAVLLQQKHRHKKSISNRQEMKNKLLFILFASLFVSCVQNLVTGRKQLKLVSESELQYLAKQEYSGFISENKVLNPGVNKDAEMVKRVGSRIASVIKTYYDGKGMPSVLDGYEWEFNLADNKDANAWAMPGGKVMVYTGLLDITKNESALAIVLGHEITHAIAQHGSERMSQALLQQFGGMGLQIALANKPAETQNMFMTVYGIGSTVGGLLPFSRKEESEADKFGLYFSAMAGYNPEEAIPFWSRMAAAGGSKPPEFLSSHPSEETRITKMKQNMPKALQFYKASRK